MSYLQHHSGCGCSQFEEQASVCPPMRTPHVHEIQGSTEVIVHGCNGHNHRFATVSGEAIPTGPRPQDHIHKVKFVADTFEGHEHEFCGETTEATIVGDRHVHFIKGTTSEDANHTHGFRGVTLLDNTIGEIL